MDISPKRIYLLIYVFLPDALYAVWILHGQHTRFYKKQIFHIFKVILTRVAILKIQGCPYDSNETAVYMKDTDLWQKVWNMYIQPI